jgi:hypothetical protein
VALIGTAIICCNLCCTLRAVVLVCALLAPMRLVRLQVLLPLQGCTLLRAVAPSAGVPGYVPRLYVVPYRQVTDRAMRLC